MKREQPQPTDLRLASPRAAGNVLSAQPPAGSARLRARSALGPAAARALEQETLCPGFGLPVKTFG